jgi:hypothetical protein
MIAMPSFFILNEEGESMLPDSFNQNKNVNCESVLYLDANICLDILNFFENKGLSDKALINIQTLILFCQQNKMEVVPKFGAMELCYNRNSQKLDITKYREFVNKIIYTFDRPFNESYKLNRLDFNYEVEVGEMDVKAFEAFFPLVLISYVTLLKIHILCKKNNPQKNNVIKNVKLFLHWCDKHLNASMASEIQLAIKIFGGVSEFKKMIAVDKKGNVSDNILRPIWGTSWDFFHMRMIHFSTMNSKMEYKTYFVTQDGNISTLFKSYTLDGAITCSSQPFMSFVSYIMEIPYKDEYILEELYSILNEFLFERARKSQIEEQYNMNLLFSLKNELENEIYKLNE